MNRYKMAVESEVNGARCGVNDERAHHGNGIIDSKHCEGGEWACCVLRRPARGCSRR